MILIRRPSIRAILRFLPPIFSALVLLRAGTVSAATVRLVVGGGALGVGDVALRSMLTGMGHAVNLRQGPAEIADTAGNDLIIISSTVTASEVDTCFRNVSKPVIVMRYNLFDKMGMVSSAANQAALSSGGSITLSAPSHFLAAGLNGTVRICSSSDQLNWGVPSAAALRIATLPTDVARDNLFAYEAGAQMPGLAAPGRRLAFPWRRNSAANATEAGLALFRAAVTWSLGQDEVIPSAPPSIVTGPSPVTVLSGLSAAFAVSVSGHPAPTLQWRRNGVDIPGATGAGYTLASTLPGDDGAVITVAATNAHGTAVSAGALLTVQYAPIVLSEPQGVVVEYGEPVHFRVQASGNPAPAFQWRRNGEGIPGAVGSSYSPDVSDPANEGAQYAVRIYNAVGETVAGPMRFAIRKEAPAITSPVQSTTVRVGEQAFFQVAASGLPAPTFQWYRNGEAIPGATAPLYIFGPVSFSDTVTRFTVAASNPFGLAVSGPAFLDVVSPPTITSGPLDTIVSIGARPVLSAKVTGYPYPAVQWSRNGVPIPGATGADYTLPPATAADDSTTYQAIVRNSFGADTSRAALVRVLHAPVLNSQPMLYHVFQGARMVFEPSVLAKGYPAPTFEWTCINHPGCAPDSTGRRMVARTDLAPLYMERADYYVLVRNSQGTSQMAMFTVYVHSVLDVPASPASATRKVGESVTFIADPGPSFPGTRAQWRKDGVDIPGATALAYTIPSVTLAHGGTYTSSLTHEFFASISRPAVLTIQEPPRITRQPLGATLSDGATATFTVEAIGTPAPSFQWRRNGADIPGATSASYTTPPATAADDGATYTVSATNGIGSAVSDTVFLSVRYLAFTLEPQDAKVESGESHAFTAEAFSNPPAAYQWYRNGAAVPGATGSSFDLDAIPQSADGDLFHVTATNTLGSIHSATARLTVTPPGAAPAIVSQPADFTGYVGDVIRFKVAATGIPAPTYQWRWNGMDLQGETADSLVLAEPAGFGDDHSTVRVVIRNRHGLVASRTAAIRVLPRGSRRKVSLAGELFRSDGTPVGNGYDAAVDVQVSLFAADTGGTPVYTESFLASQGQAAKVRNGLFTLRLGEGSASRSLDEVAARHGDLHAEFRIREEGRPFETLSPRTPITSPLFAGSPRVLEGWGAPTASEPAGTYYEDARDGVVWLRMVTKWIRIGQ